MTTEYESIESLQPLAPEHMPWSEELARQIAAADGIGELSESHWKVIHTLREHFVQYGALPPMSLACGLNHLDPHCSDELFHGTTKAWRVAGLPEPGAEGMGYM